MSGRPTVVLATHNEHKRLEFQAMLPELDLKSAQELGLPEPEETGQTYHDNAKLKADAAAVATGFPALADDSGLSVLGLDGDPGIYSARWAGPDRDFNLAMAKVIDRLIEKYGSFEAADRRAEFIASLCLSFPDGDHAFFDGICPGTLVCEPKGTRGFGYDPIFMPEDHAITFGEMAEAAKNRISHRARAIAVFQDWLKGDHALCRRLHGIV